jgi:hypothetical protein
MRAPLTKSSHHGGFMTTTRVLGGVAATLLASGCAIGVIGVHPAARPALRSTALNRAGLLMILGSIPLWVTAEVRRMAAVTSEQLEDAHTAGYQLGVAHSRSARRPARVVTGS